MTHDLASRIDASTRAIAALKDDAAVPALCQAIADRLGKGGTLFTAGNGGSAAQAMHLAEELIGRYRDDRPPVPAVCLNADPTALTCIANDYGFETIFERPCEALLREGDALLVCSTTGRSENLVRALAVARGCGALAAGLLGGDGGPCADACDACVIVASTDPATIQDAHQVLLHLVCEVVEQRVAAMATPPPRG